MFALLLWKSPLYTVLKWLWVWVFLFFSASESEPGGGGEYKILCVLTRLVALCFIFTRGWGLGTKSTCRKGLGTNTKRHFTHISAMQAALIGGRQRKKGHYLTPWTAQLLPLFVSDLKPDHLSGSGLFWDAAVCSLRRHTKHSDGMTDLESSSSPPNRCPAPVAQPPLPISRISSQSAPSSGDTHICTHTYVCVHTFFLQNDDPGWWWWWSAHPRHFFLQTDGTLSACI